MTRRVISALFNFQSNAGIGNVKLAGLVRLAKKLLIVFGPDSAGVPKIGSNARKSAEFGSKSRKSADFGSSTDSSNLVRFERS